MTAATLCRVKLPVHCMKMSHSLYLSGRKFSYLLSRDRIDRSKGALGYWVFLLWPHSRISEGTQKGEKSGVQNHPAGHDNPMQCPEPGCLWIWWLSSVIPFCFSMTQFAEQGLGWVERLWCMWPLTDKPSDWIGCPRAGHQLLGPVSHSRQRNYLLNYPENFVYWALGVHQDSLSPSMFLSFKYIQGNSSVCKLKGKTSVWCAQDHKR